MEFRFDITPLAHQSVRFTKSGIAYPDREYLKYKRKLLAMAKDQVKRYGYSISNAPVSLIIRFYYKPNKSWSKKKQKAVCSDPIPKTTRPDLDNCIKPFLDAFNHYLWHDDSCIYRLEASKEHYHSTCIVMNLEATNERQD